MREYITEVGFEIDIPEKTIKNLLKNYNIENYEFLEKSYYTVFRSKKYISKCDNKKTQEELREWYEKNILKGKFEITLENFIINKRPRVILCTSFNNNIISIAYPYCMEDNIIEEVLFN